MSPPKIVHYMCCCGAKVGNPSMCRLGRPFSPAAEQMEILIQSAREIVWS